MATTSKPRSEHLNWEGNALLVDDVVATNLFVNGTGITGTEIGYVDGITPGTVTASKAVVVDSNKDAGDFRNLDAVNIDAGADAVAGTIDIYPTTTATGKIQIAATDSAGAFTTTITNASQAAARTYTIPDAGASASFVMTAGAQTVAGVKTFSSIPVFPTTGITLNATTITEAEIGVLDSAAAANNTTGKAAILGTNGAVTFAGAITPSGGVAAGGGFAVTPYMVHTGGIPAQVNTDGTDATPSVTETYICAVHVPCNMTITGVSVFLGSATEGNIKVGLANSSGAVVATSASTDCSGATVDSYFRVAFTGTYAAAGPATYYVLLLNDNTANRFNAHTFGDFPASKKTGETYATGFTTITPPTTFTTALGPIASLY